MFDFSKKYIRKDFLEFLENTLPSDIIFKEKEYKIKNSNSLITKITNLANIPSLENIEFFEVEHKSINDPRITLTKEIFKVLNKLSINYALIIFYSPDSNNYRLSYIESNYEWKTDTRVFKKFSQPKRLSFLVGKMKKYILHLINFQENFKFTGS